MQLYGITLGLILLTRKRSHFGALVTYWCKTLIMKNIKKTTQTNQSAYRQLEEVIGCKWSVAVLNAVANNVIRPGKIERHIEGISKKVLSERLRKLTEYGLLRKQVYAEVPPRTEYSLSKNGKKLICIVDQINTLDEQIRNA